MESRGEYKRAEPADYKKLDQKIVQTMRQEYEGGAFVSDIAARYEQPIMIVYDIVTRRIWRHVK